MQSLSLLLKNLNRLKQISYINLPPKLLFLLKQGCEKDAEVQVSSGKKIKRGELLAKGHDSKSQYLHTSAGGQVKKVRSISFLKDDNEFQGIEIDTGGSFNVFEHSSDTPIDFGKEYSEKEFSSLVLDSGIYDTDTGVFSTYITSKLENPEVQSLIINAVEFSPFKYLEEKILELHSEEIIYAANVLLNLFLHKNKKIDIKLISNYFSNQIQFYFMCKKKSNANVSISSLKKIKTEESFDKHKIQNNLKILEWKLNKKKFGYESVFETGLDNEFLNQSIVLRPSTLYALYEFLAFNKPFIDAYVQICLGYNTIIIQKVPLGTPLLYLLSPFNKGWKQFPKYCFAKSFFDPLNIKSMSIPFSKHIRNFWLLDDPAMISCKMKIKSWLAIDTVEAV